MRLTGSGRYPRLIDPMSPNSSLTTATISPCETSSGACSRFRKAAATSRTRRLRSIVIGAIVVMFSPGQSTDLSMPEMIIMSPIIIGCFVPIHVVVDDSHHMRSSFGGVRSRRSDEPFAPEVYRGCLVWVFSVHAFLPFRQRFS